MSTSVSQLSVALPWFAKVAEPLASRVNVMSPTVSTGATVSVTSTYIEA